MHSAQDRGGRRGTLVFISHIKLVLYVYSLYGVAHLPLLAQGATQLSQGKPAVNEILPPNTKLSVSLPCGGVGYL